MQPFRYAIIAIMAFAVLSISGQTVAQVPEPDGGGVRRGVLPRSWQASGPECPEKPTFQVQAYNDDFYILRESGCSNYEKPFVFLLFGTDRALLLDTGAGNTDIAAVVTEIVGRWLSKNQRDAIDLIVAHTHAHKDHIAGDEQLRELPRTTVVPPTVAGVQSFFHFRSWPTEISTYDLGHRVLDVIPIPGHEASSIAV
ncbi:MAG TPA: MBL fold metallo-hydrolase, partial [Steroidobacteraceae bacterium]